MFELFVYYLFIAVFNYLFVCGGCFVRFEENRAVDYV